MNFLKSLALVAVLVLGSQAFAGTVYLNFIGDREALPSCGGYVELSTTLILGTPALKVVGNSQCSRIEVDGMVYKSQDYEKIALVSGRTVARVHSVSGKHRDTVIVDFAPTFAAHFSSGASWTYLPSCGGMAELSVVNGQVRLSLRNVQQCSNFDILSANGEPVPYPNQKLGGYQGSRSGMFVLPRSLYQYGFNGMQVIVKSNNNGPRGHRDVLNIRFVY